MNRKLFFVFLFLVLVFSLTTNTTGRAAPDDSPAESNVLNIARWYDISMLDPALAYDSASAEVIANLYSTLITLNPADPAIVNPALATGWNVSADGKTYTFTIRRGVAFHDGTLLAPSDVAYSLQRGLLQSDPGSPQWIFIRAIMGYSWGDITQEIAGGAYAGDPEGLIANADLAELLATCQKVKERVQANDAAGTVTVTLDAANGSFLSTLATYGYVLNGDWAKAQMDWDGDCATWQYHYAPSYTTGSKLADKANGSGGFRLVSWTPDESLILQRHAAYWRPRPQAAVPLEEVHIRVVSPTEIPALLQSGQADIGSIPPNDEAAMDALVLLEYRSGNPVPILRHSSGVLTKLSGTPTPTASSDVALTFDIDTAGPRNYIGSGQFDGNGIPPAFFSDIHVRKAFAYAFDYNTFNADIYGGEGIRRTGPIIKPLMGYKSSQSVYPYDLTQAATELAAAWGGQAAANGFKLTIAYNEGNTTRQRVAELFKAGIEAIDPKYRIDLTAIPWPDYLNDHRNGRLPLSVNSWIQDYAHPDNWVRPYLTETNAIRQRLPEPMRLAYEQQADACLLMQGPPARACYEALQTQAYNDTATIYMFQNTRTDFVRSELFGLQTARSLDGAIDYAQLWKGGTPATATIAPDSSGMLSAVGASGIQMNVAFPVGSLAEPKVILARPDIDTAGRLAPDGLKPGRLAFELSDWTPATTRATDLAFAKPVEVKLTYTAGQITPLIESGLVLMHWSGSAWLPAACGDVTADPVANTLSVPVCKTGEFQLMGPAFDAKIPMIAK